MSKEVRNCGTSVFGLLGVAFIVLKLTGVIAWSWWWVLAPFWVGIAIFIAMAIFIFILAMIGYSIYNGNKDRKF